MVVEKKKYEERNTQKSLNNFSKVEEMVEWFMAVDCKSIEFLIAGSNPAFFLKLEIWRSW